MNLKQGVCIFQVNQRAGNLFIRAHIIRKFPQRSASSSQRASYRGFVRFHDGRSEELGAANVAGESPRFTVVSRQRFRLCLVEAAVRQSYFRVQTPVVQSQRFGARQRLSADVAGSVDGRFGRRRRPVRPVDPRLPPLFEYGVDATLVVRHVAPRRKPHVTMVARKAMGYRRRLGRVVSFLFRLF